MTESTTKKETTVVLPPVKDGEMATVMASKYVSKVTTPPTAYTEDTLLGDMEGASKYVEDETLRKILKSISGLGTAATRAKIIETLKSHKYLEKNGKHIVATEKGLRFIKWVKTIAPELTDVAQTARWQAKLEVMEADPNSTRVPFEKDVIDFVKSTVTIFKQAASLGGNTTENDMSDNRAPTAKMLEFAKKIADKTGKKLTDETMSDFEACKQFIDENKDAANGPSEKQVKFAEGIAKSKGLTIPGELLKDGRALSKWIDENK